MRNTWKIWPMFSKDVREMRLNAFKASKKVYLWSKSASTFPKIRRKYLSNNNEKTLFNINKGLLMLVYWFFLSFDYRLPQIYEEFYHTVNNADHEKDLRLWSNTHGVNMAMNWPQFEVLLIRNYLVIYILHS